MGLNTLVPGLGTIANQAFNAFKKVWDWFKKPSETELAARETFASMHRYAVDSMTDTARFTDSVQRLIDDGWDRTLAETKVSFELMAEAAGHSWQEGSRLYTQYEQAVRDGNTDLMADIDAQFKEWQRQAGETADANTAAFGDSKEELSLIHI